MSGSKIRLYGSTSGFVELEAPAVAPDGTLTLPSTFAGVGSNVVQTVKADTFSTTSTSFTPVTNLEVDITPTTDTSKVLVIATLGVGHSNNNFLVAVNLRRDTTNLAQPSSGTALSSLGANDVGTALASTSLVFLDSPNTASSVNYNITMRVTSGTGYLNRGGNDANVTRVSTLTVIEVAA